MENMVRNNFLSLNDISKRHIGFKFCAKNNDTIFELTSVKKKKVHVASGFLGDVYQNMITIECIDKFGNIYKQNNLKNELKGDTIFDVKFVKDDWDSFEFRTLESLEKENRKRYINYLLNFKNKKETYLNYLKSLNEIDAVEFENTNDEIKKINLEIEIIRECF